MNDNSIERKRIPDRSNVMLPDTYFQCHLIYSKYVIFPSLKLSKPTCYCDYYYDYYCDIDIN